MAASCYPCDVGISPKPGGQATNSPHGVCGICGVMACDGHAKREPNRPRFECVICIPIVAAVSAALQARSVTPLAQRLAGLLVSLGGEAWLVKSVDDFLQSYGEFAVWLDRLPSMRQRAQIGFVAGDTEPFYSSLDESGRDLMLLAIIIVIGLEIPTWALPEPLQRLVQPWR
jgi:hypothetical protein